MKQALFYLLAFLVWNAIAGTILFVAPPALGLPVALAVTALFFRFYILRRPRGLPTLARWAWLRLRPLRGDALYLTLAAMPVLFFLTWSIGDLYTRMIPVPPESFNPFGDMMDSPSGTLALAIFAIVVAPLAEEFVFRGLIQRGLERRRGPALGIAMTAGLFALIHFLPWVFPLHFMIGLILGFIVYATRSLWSGVLLHAANNTMAMIGILISGGETEATPTLWEIGWTSDVWTTLAILVLSVAAAWWIATRLLELRHRPGTVGSAAAALP